MQRHHFNYNSDFLDRGLSTDAIFDMPVSVAFLREFLAAVLAGVHSAPEVRAQMVLQV